jgi:hypothetical protein
MFCIVNNVVVCIVIHIIVLLTIVLLTIQNITLSYCHIVNIVTILHILSCIVNNIARDWFADAPGPFPAGLESRYQQPRHQLHRTGTAGTPLSSAENSYN